MVAVVAAAPASSAKHPSPLDFPFACNIYRWLH